MMFGDAWEHLLRIGKDWRTMAGALDVIEVIVEGALLAQRVLSVYQWIVTEATPDEDVIADIEDVLAAGMYNELTTTLADNYTISNLEFRNKTDNVLMDIIPWVGDAFSNVGELLPLGVAGLITVSTATPGVRGRKFLPGLTEGSCADSLWGGTTVTAMSNFAAVWVSPFLGAVSGAPYAPGVMDKNGVFRPFTEAIISNIPAYQRRRKQGVGE